MNIEAASKLRQLALAKALPEEQEQEAAPNPNDAKVRGKFGRLTPVNEEMHAKLTKSGYKHDSNFETNNGQGRFGYYSHPVSGHRITVDEQGNIQEQQQPMQQKGQGQRGNAGQQRW